VPAAARALSTKGLGSSMMSGITITSGTSLGGAAAANP
jgi:hypothetical protein